MTDPVYETLENILWTAQQAIMVHGESDAINRIIKLVKDELVTKGGEGE
jgi:hypothetical protein